MAQHRVYLTDEDIEYIKSLDIPVGASLSRGKSLIEKLEKSKQRIQTSSAKAKGRALQQEVAQALAEVPPGFSYYMVDDEAEISSRQMGQHGSDIPLRGRARNLIDFSFECKATKDFSFSAAMKQAEDDRDKEYVSRPVKGVKPIAVVVHRPYRDGIYVIMRLNSFCAVLKNLIAYKLKGVDNGGEEKT
jgi:hypothetical protein